MQYYKKRYFLSVFFHINLAALFFFHRSMACGATAMASLFCRNGFPQGRGSVTFPSGNASSPSTGRRKTRLVCPRENRPRKPREKKHDGADDGRKNLHDTHSDLQCFTAIAKSAHTATDTRPVEGRLPCPAAEHGDILPALFFSSLYERLFFPYIQAIYLLAAPRLSAGKLPFTEKGPEKAKVPLREKRKAPVTVQHATCTIQGGSALCRS